MADKFPCVACRKEVTKTKNDRYWSHSDGDGEPCGMSSEQIPEHVLANPTGKDDQPDVPREGIDYATCPQCDRKVKLTRMGYFEPHDTTLRGGDRCEVSGVRAKHARKTETVPLPGDEPLGPEVAVPEVSAQEEITSRAATSESAGAASSPKELPPGTGAAEPVDTAASPTASELDGLGPLTHPGAAEAAELKGDRALAAGSSAPTETNSPESPTISQPSPAPSAEPESTSSGAPSSPPDGATAPQVVQFHLAPLLDEVILQPFSHILQPTPYEKVRPIPMGDLAKELATKIKETFYAYSNRKTSDNRSAQTTLGPSEIGTPCDRRLAMSLLGVAPVNPGGDGWAAFVGTCTHVGMAEIYTFADAGTGRYAVELPVFLGMPTVPRGTTDLLDRRDGTVIDWKVMGSYSLKKFKEQGPSPTYRTQAHVYALGAEKGGEKVRNVAVVGLPRAGSSLDEMYVWTEKYDRKFAQAALDRVARISNEIAQMSGQAAATGEGPSSPMEAARQFETGDDCRYCPFHLKGDKEMKRGCPGK